MDELIGSLEKNKRADMISITLTAPNAVPLYNVYSQLVYALQGSDVTDVMVNGRTIVRDRRMLTLDASHHAKAESIEEGREVVSWELH